MKYRIMPNIYTPEDLGNAYLGKSNSSIVYVPPKNRIDRAEYGRNLAKLEGGIFTQIGYAVPVKKGGHNMQHNKTRQRQGRDFSLHNYLQNAELSIEGNYNNIDGIINGEPKDDDMKKTLFERLDEYKKEAERNAAPVDGYEPPERGRNLV